MASEERFFKYEGKALEALREQATEQRKKAMAEFDVVCNVLARKPLPGQHVAHDPAWRQRDDRPESAEMNADNLRTILKKHAAWQRMEDGGECADLRDADLRYSDFRDADLRGAKFRGADLRYADFRGSDLRYADFRDADFRGADFRGCNFRDADFRGAYLRGAVGLLLLPVQDPRGHSFPHAVLCEEGWRVRVGCRDFTIAEAREHWGAAYKDDREIGDAYLYAVDWLERKVASMEAER